MTRTVLLLTFGVLMCPSHQLAPAVTDHSRQLACARLTRRVGSAGSSGSGSQCGCLRLRGGLMTTSSSCVELEEGVEVPSDFSDDCVNPETGHKGECHPGSIIPKSLEEYSSEIDEWTKPRPEQNPDMSHIAEREERGVLDPSFKASTVHDESWDDEHQHLHPDRLVMQKDFITHTLFEIFQEKPLLRDIPGIANSTSFITFANDSHLDPHLRDNYEWEENLKLMHRIRHKEARGKQRGDFEAYLDMDDVDLGLDEEVYKKFEDLLPDDPDFQKGPNRHVDAEYLRRMHAYRFMHDRPYIQKKTADLEEATSNWKIRDPNCMSAVAVHNERGRQLQVAARCGHLEQVKKLVQDGVPVNFRDIVRDTPLHWAALNGEIKAVQLLISLGADMNLRTEKGRTALHHAAACTKLRVVYELIKSGADVHLSDYSNFTALDIAVHVQEHDTLNCIENHEVIRLLTLAGCSPTRPPSPARSPEPEHNPKISMPMDERFDFIVNKTKGKVYDMLTLQECTDGGDHMTLPPNMTGAQWTDFCDKTTGDILEDVKEHEDKELYRMMKQIDSGRYTKIIGPDDDGNGDESSEERIVGDIEQSLRTTPATKIKVPVPIWKKKGPLTVLEREKIDSMGKKAMSSRAKKALNLPRPPPRR